MDTLNKISQLLKEKGCTQKDLTDYLGLEKTTFSSWKSGKSKSYMKLIDKIAEFFKVSPNYFYNSEPNHTDITPNEMSLLSNYRILRNVDKTTVYTLAQNLAEAEMSREIAPATITIQHSLHKVSAGTGYMLLDEDNLEEITILDSPTARKADLALTITGDSMSPEFEDGDIVLIRLQPAVYENEICIYIVNGDGYIKKFGGDRLISINPQYDDIILSENNENKCVGLVIGKATRVE